MLRALILSVFLLSYFQISAQDIDSNSVLGTWLTSEGECQIKIFRVGQEYYGKTVWLKVMKDENGEDCKDINNSNPALRNRPTLGLMVLSGFKYDQDGKWIGGTIYNPDNGRKYKAQLRINTFDKLYVRGYIGIPAVGAKTKWTRVK